MTPSNLTKCSQLLQQPLVEVVTTAKANGLNPRKSVQWLLEEMPNAADPDDPTYLDSLMPWSESVPTG